VKKIFVFIFLFFFSASLFADQLIIEPDAGRAPLLSALSNAHEIDLITYGLTDETFINALIHAKKSGKTVHVLIERAPYKSENENIAAINQLRAANIDVTEGNPAFKFTHQKTFIFDNSRAFVMTFNLTHSTFQNERNFALLITDPAEINEIKNIFSADVLRKSITPSNPNLIWSPDNSREKILSALKNAHSHIEIYAENLNDYDIIGTLSALARQGIEVKILHSENQSYNKKFQYLQRAGVQLKQSKKLIIHAKVILIDNQLAVIGSINLTKNSLDHNRELSVITHEREIIGILSREFNQDWENATSRQYHSQYRNHYGHRHIHHYFYFRL